MFKTPLKITRLRDTERGQCYYNVFRFIVANMDGPHEWFMVQGVVDGKINLIGQRIGHCWAEVKHEGRWYVYEPYHHVLTSQELYYAHAKAACIHKYDALTMLKTAVGLGQVGAWTEDVGQAGHA